MEKLHRGDTPTSTNPHETMLREVVVRDGVVVRPMLEADAAQLLGIMERDPSIRDHVTVAAAMQDADGVRKQVEAYTNDNSVIRYVIVHDGDVAGLVSFWRDTGYFGYTPMPYTFGFGYFTDPKRRGQHLAGDSVQALMNEAQKSFRVDQFIAFTETDNEASQHVLRSLGFAKTDIDYTEPNMGWAESMWCKKVAQQ